MLALTDANIPTVLAPEERRAQNGVPRLSTRLSEWTLGLNPGKQSVDVIGHNNRVQPQPMLPTQTNLHYHVH